MTRVISMIAAAAFLMLPATAQAQRGGMGGGGGGMGGMGMGGYGPQRFPVPELPGPELDGPPDSSQAAGILSLTGPAAAKYAASYDSFMVGTRGTRDSVHAQLTIMHQKLDGGDRAAATFYAERATKLSKSLKDRQEKWEEQLAKVLSGDQVKAYKKWKKDTDVAAEGKRREAEMEWQGGGGADGFGEARGRGARGAPGTALGMGDAGEKTVVNPGSAVGGMDGISQAVRVGRMLYVSGQVALDSMGQVVGTGDLKTQAAKAFTNLAAVLKAGKAEPGDVVRLTVYVVNYKPEDLVAIRAAATWFFPGRFAPAMTVVGVQSLFKEGLLVAVDAIAQVTNPQPVTPAKTPG